MTRWMGAIPVSAMLLLGAMGAAMADVEEPEYAVARVDGAIEIRDYPELATARIVQPGSRSEASSPAFRRLAVYIFDEDRPQGAIEMTAPVIMAPDGAGGTAMQFVMPDRFDIASLPTPDDPGISLQTVPARRMAVIRFSGWASDRDLLEQEAALREWLAGNDLVAIGSATWAFYNPPWTLGPWRRNEVLIEVER